VVRRVLWPDAGVGPIEPVDLAALDAAALDDATLARLARGQAGTTPGASGPEATATATLTAMRTSRLDADTLAAAGLSTTTSGLEPLLVELDGRTVATGTGDVTLRLRADELSVRFHTLGLVRRVLHAATTGPFVYLLLVFGLGLLLFEVFQPGFGVAGLAGVITAGVGIAGAFVLPVRWWAVALVVLGLLLYALDTAIAGFGPVTLAATGAFAAGSWWFYAAPVLQLEWWLVALATVSALVFFVFVLTVVLRAQAGPEGTVVDELVGRPGVVRSTLNPEGHVFIDGALWRARWIDDGRAGVGSPVVVTAVDGPVVLVQAFDPAKVGGAPGGPSAGVASEGMPS
jgi:membrane-bound serine protease (ClpP class)